MRITGHTKIIQSFYRTVYYDCKQVTYLGFSSENQCLQNILLSSLDLINFVSLRTSDMMTLKMKYDPHHKRIHSRLRIVMIYRLNIEPDVKCRLIQIE